MAGSGLGPGQVFAGYRIERMLGIGGMGEVYLARDRSLPREVALKLLTPAGGRDPEVRRRFQREADIVAHLTHPNIVTVHARGEEQGQLWIAMGYVRGTDVAEALRAGALGLERAVRILTATADALDCAHDAGVLHRDVKPANILLGAGSPELPVLTDFGIAKILDEDVALTRTGDVLASFQYAAPERLDSRTAGDDRRGDVYSLGCTFFHMLTGVPPYPGSSAAQLIHAHVYAPVPAASHHNPTIPAAVDRVLARALAKNPADRFDTCGQFAAAVTAALIATPDPSPVPGRTSARLGPPAAHPDILPPLVFSESGQSPVIASHRPVPVLARFSRTPPRRRRILWAGLAGAAVAAVLSYLVVDNSATQSRPLRVTATIKVGNKASGIALNPTAHSAYVTNQGSNSVSVIDTSTNAVIATIPVGIGPAAVAIDPALHAADIANYGDTTVTVIDTTSNTVNGTNIVGKSPAGVAIDPATHTSYIANYSSDTVSIVDAAPGGVSAGPGPIGVAIDTVGHRVYVADNSDRTVTVLDTVTHGVTGTIRVGDNPVGVAADPAGHTIYVTNATSNTLSVIDTNRATVIDTIPVGTDPRAVAVDPAAHTAYVTNWGSNTVSVIDTATRTVTDNVKVGEAPLAVTVDPATHKVYVTQWGGTVSVLSR